MKKKPLDYEIENVGGIDHVQLRLVPGVNVLRGHNAAGKSSAMDAISRAQGASVPIERRDGTESGTVTGPGVSLRIRNVVKTTGDAEMQLADSGPLARLIDPGLKGTDAAARERVRALIELLELSVDDSFLVQLCQGDEGLLKWLRTDVKMEAVEDLMIASERLRNHSHGLAREQEDVVERSTGESAAIESRCKELLEAIGGPEQLSHETVETTKDRLDKVVRKHEREVAQCEAREELAEKQKAIAETLGDRPDYEQAGREMQSIGLKVESLDQEIDDLSAKVMKLQFQRDAERSKFKIAEKLVREREDTFSKWKRASEILDQPLEGPTRGYIELIKKDYVDRAHRELESAQRTHEYRVEEEKKAEAERTRDEADRLAIHYRDVSSAIPKILGEILADAGAPGLTVIDGRLHAIVTPNKHKDFEHRCSTGERVALALEVAATVYHGKVLPLDGLLWASLDPENRAAFAELAEKLSLYVITEEPATGTLRLENE